MAYVASQNGCGAGLLTSGLRKLSRFDEKTVHWLSDETIVSRINYTTYELAVKGHDQTGDSYIKILSNLHGLRSFCQVLHSGYLHMETLHQNFTTFSLKKVNWRYICLFLTC